MSTRKAMCQPKVQKNETATKDHPLDAAFLELETVIGIIGTLELAAENDLLTFDSARNGSLTGTLYAVQNGLDRVNQHLHAIMDEMNGEDVSSNVVSLKPT